MKIVNDEEIISGERVVQNYVEIENAMKNGETVLHWEGGESLSPIINHLEYCEIAPINPEDVKRGDCVFCKIKGVNGGFNYMVHQVWEISDCGFDGRLWFKIGSTFGTIFGWTDEVLGIARGTNIYHSEESWLESLEHESYQRG